MSVRRAINGTYTVYATFAGSGAYYGSYAETALAVQNPPPQEVVTPPPVEQPTIVEQYFVPAVAGIIVAIIVSVAVAVLVLSRKRQ